MSKETAIKNAELAWRVYTQAYHNTESFEGIGCHLAYLIGGILDGQKLCLYTPLDPHEYDFMKMIEDAFDDADEVWDWIEITDDSISHAQN